ncbi:MAG TPA: hypothetical protein PKI19_02550 [Elusimicrobiales bacterium]|nr:hypothetical protein [Elusimicrobiales bacterium]
MKIRDLTAAAMLSLLLAQGAAAIKTGADGVAVLGDGLEYSAGAVGQYHAANGGTAVDGALGGVAYSSSSFDSVQLESGFYSRMVNPQANVSVDSPEISSYTLLLADQNDNPDGTSYDVFISTWNSADRYMSYRSTTGAELVEALFPNTSYYNFVLANYMEGDYSGLTPVTAVTHAAPVSSDTFRFADVGHNTLNLSFSAFANPGPADGAAWAQAAQSLPAVSQRYGQAAVIYGSHVFVSGGYDGTYASSAVYRAEMGPAGLSAWAPAGFLKEAVYGHQMLAARGRLYIVGGHSQGAILSKVWSADLSTGGAPGAWEAETPLPFPLYFHAAVLAGKWIHVSGGYTTGGVSQQIRSATFNEAGALSAWSNTYNLPGPRYAHAMVSFADRLYVAGGRDGALARSEVWWWDMSPGGALIAEAENYASLPAPRYGHAMLAAENALYVIGGNDGSGVRQTVFISSAAALAADSGPWRAAAAAGPLRQFAAGAASGGRFYLAGGSDGNAPSNEVYASEPAGTRYTVEASSDAAFAAELRTSGWLNGYDCSFGDLNPGVTYYVRVKAINRLNVPTVYSAAASTITYSAVPGTAAWSEVGVASAKVQWLANGNPAGTQYEVKVSSCTDYKPSCTLTDVAIGQSLSFSGLLPNTTYYAKARVLNSPGGPSRFADLPTAFTLFDPDMDNSSPTVSGLMLAAALSWHSTNTFACDIDFADNQQTDSGLDRFSLKTSTKPDDAAGSWTAGVTGINSGSYSQDWTIPQEVWEAMREGTSNYISVMAWDRAENTTTYLDVFSVLKDTTAPLIFSSYEPPAGRLTEAPVPELISGLRFEDALSGLYKAQYSVSLNPNNPDAEVIGWTTIDDPQLTQGATYYEPLVPYSFAQLASAASNYFSLRAVDVAGSTYTWNKVFGIGKNVSGPAVTISSPTALQLFLSTFGYVAGGAAPSNGHAVQRSEVSLRDLFQGKFYTGSAFTADSRVWFNAAGAAPAFNYIFQNLALVSGRQYQVVARSSDSAGDYSQTFATHTFTYDTQAPDTLVLLPGQDAVYSGSSFSGSADDPAGLSAVNIALQRVATGKWWDGMLGWNTQITAVSVVNPVPDWSYTFPAHLRDALVHGASYYITAYAADGASPPNAGVFKVSGSTFAYSDTTPPPATLSLAAGAGTQRGSVLLSWQTAGDNAYTGYLPLGAYKIFYATYTPAQVSTAAAQISISTTGLNAGATQARLVTGLEAGASYYFTLWTADDAANWSPLSNEAMAIANILDSGALTGSVLDASTQALTGVLVEALGETGAVEGSDYTNTLGRYSISGLSSAILSVRATLTVQDIESMVSKDQVTNGAGGVDFRLSATYQLAAISGVIPAGFMPQRYAAPSGARYTTSEVRAEQGQPFAEIYRRGRRIGAAFVDANGGFEVPNLLPATYGVRVYNGTDFSKMETVKLRPGERFTFTPKFDLLNKDSVFAYPNPVNGKWVYVHFSPVNTLAISAAQVEVFDITGRLVKTLKDYETDNTYSGGGSRFAWDLSRENVASGVYVFILRMRGVSGEVVKPVIKKFAIIR